MKVYLDVDGASKQEYPYGLRASISWRQDPGSTEIAFDEEPVLDQVATAIFDLDFGMDGVRAVIDLIVQQTFDVAFGMGQQDNFPRFGLQVGEEQFFLTMNEAAKLWNTGLAPVKLFAGVLESDMTVRPITDEEMKELQQLADDYSDSK